MVLGRLRAVELHLRLDGVISGSDHTDAFPPTAPLAERLRSLLLLPGSPTHMHRKSGRLLMACIRCGQGGISAFVRTACNGLLVGLQLCENDHHPPLVEIKTWGSGPEIFQGRLLGGPWRYVLPKLFQRARAITWLFHFNMRLPRKLAQMWRAPLRVKGSVTYNPRSYTLNPQP